MICIIDYNMGNLRSVVRKFERLGAEVCISSNADEIGKADKLVLPGVGHFANGVKHLKELGIWGVLNHKVLIRKTPILGICLGMQLMAKHSEEGDCEGLGWFDAEVVKFKIQNKQTYKVPHMGWNSAERQKESSLFDQIPEEAPFYFVHSYHFKCNDHTDVLTQTSYEYPFVSSVEKENIYGTQFHPEKSHDFGEQLIHNFIKY